MTDPGRDGATYRPVVLVVMDGWRVAPPGPDNAVSLAATPVFDRLVAEYPHGVLDASGPAVGLPPGQMGNSEVGHLNIGAGRVVYQELTRIDRAIEDGSLSKNPVLIEAMDGAAAEGRSVHFMGLVSDGGVHSHISHLLARKPTDLMMEAVKGMLPKGPLGRKLLKKLKVYAGPDHPHQAQKPQAITE